MAKEGSAQRRAEEDALRAAARRRERRRAWLLLVGVGALILALVGIVAVPYVKDIREQHRIEHLKLSDIGTSPSAAGCLPRQSEPVTVPKSGWHVKNGTKLTYAESPPAYGMHWAVPLSSSQYRTFFSVRDRPAEPLLVHSLEHGHTVVWYDETLAADSAGMGALHELADRFQNRDGVVIVPWTSADGDAFPDGAHLALTHWTGGKKQHGIHQYCTGVSGTAIKSFLVAYPRSDAPEKGAP